jgi:CRP/FNR family cyclic AMP-dependent transcriptional regulator
MQAAMVALEVTYQKLAGISLFQALSPETLGALVAHCRLVNLPSGEVLFHQGDTSLTLYLIESGEVDLIHDYEDGEKLVLVRLGPHDVIGDASMISNQPRTATAIAITDVVLIALDREIFFQYLSQHPSMAVEVLVQMSLRLRDLTLRLREIAATNAPARLASLILFLAEEHGEIKTGLITTNFRPQYIARAAGVDIEWLFKQLKEWEHEGYIGHDKRRLLLHDANVLMQIAGWT